MTVLLQIRNAHKRYGDQILLEGAECTLTSDTKVGFIGRNGAGKSTLLKCILGDDELDTGEIIRHPKLKIGYLRQHDPFLPGETALEFLMRDSGQPDWKCGEVAGEFEIKGKYLEAPLQSLSGGWQTRVKLSALLLHEPNLLLLDEPTNFLDLRTQILLEHFLRSFNEACLIVSHDRAFLNATCDSTLDLSMGELTLFPGKVDAFLEYQQELNEHDQRTNASISAKRKQLQEFIDRNRARASTATRAKSKSKMLDRLEMKDVVSDQSRAIIRAPQFDPRQGPAVRCRDLSIGYGDRVIASEITLEIEHGMRAAIVGDNGQGKTTLLRTLVQSLNPLSGDVRWGYGCELGTYAQHVYTSLPESKTVLEYLEYESIPGTKSQTILDMAGAMLFRGTAVNKRISVLSGGERARLCMASLLLGKANILILDEPGNHLDVETVEALADALIDYKGTVIFTSHDRHFLKRVATAFIEVKDGGVTHYRGNYDAYLYMVQKEIDDEESRRNEAKPKTNSKSSSKPSSKSAAPSPLDQRQIRKQIGNVEKTIAKLDTQRKQLNEQMMQATEPKEAMRLHEELTQVTADLESAETKWAELQEQLESVD
ncbi:MAG: ABC-F family ATP-binding cassette domain-containing protein [Planctomycetes bacterium]|nr:ABC-F family ATP-binding cassette domain-containing protein [Planctomycetota bacterium]